LGISESLNQSGSIRTNLSLGNRYTVHTEPENWEKIDNNPVSVAKN